MSRIIITMSRTLFFQLLAHAPEGPQREVKGMASRDGGWLQRRRACNPPEFSPEPMKTILSFGMGVESITRILISPAYVDRRSARRIRLSLS